MEKDIGKSRNLARRFSGGAILYYMLLLVCVFWLGVYVANAFIGQRLAGKCEKEEGKSGEVTRGFEVKEKMPDPERHHQSRLEKVPRKQRKNLFSTKAFHTEPPTMKNFARDEKEDQKLIVLYGPRIWSKYDQWKDDDWEKCPQPNCRVTTDTNMIPKSSAVVFNAEAMPPATLVGQLRDIKDNTRGEGAIKFVFMSGITPDETFFNPKSYNEFFDLTMTYKSDSDIRIPFWPNNGILPAMLRPKKPGKQFSDAEINRFKERNNLYFQKEGKEGFMVYVIKKCDPRLYENIFSMRFRWEGDIAILSKDPCNATLMGFPSIEQFPCDDMYSDSCAKFMEGFKFVMVPEEHICKDHLNRAYWYTLQAWEAVPILWASDDLKTQAIPGSYIDVLSQDYVSPLYKEALARKTNGREYSQYMLWKEEDRLEEFYWQCELCEKLHSGFKTNRTESFGTFWDKEKNCGQSTALYKSARDQLIRTAAIRP